MFNFLYIIFIQFAFASTTPKNIQLNYVNKTQFKISFQKVCADKFGRGEYLIVTPNSNLKTLDCMGRDLNITDYCKNLVKNNFTRSFMSNELVCESATQASLSVVCTNKNSFLCRKEKPCEILKNSYANNLLITYSSIVDQKVNCLFQSKSNIDKIDLL